MYDSETDSLTIQFSSTHNSADVPGPSFMNSDKVEVSLTKPLYGEGDFDLITGALDFSTGSLSSQTSISYLGDESMSFCNGVGSNACDHWLSAPNGIRGEYVNGSLSNAGVQNYSYYYLDGGSLEFSFGIGGALDFYGTQKPQNWVETASTPEPASALLMLTGMGSLLLRRRRLTKATPLIPAESL